MAQGQGANRSHPAPVFVLEDDPRIVQHLRQLLATTPDYTLAVAAGSLRAARDVLDAARDCVVHLVDLRLPDGSGTQWIRDAAAWPRPPRIGVISALGDERNVVRAIEAGAQGYLLKDIRADDLVPALDALLRGESPMTPAIARHLLKRFQAAPDTGDKPSAESLSPRETEVLKLVAKGFSSAEIADLLSIAASTVLTHIKHIYGKLGVNSRSQAVFEAAQAGIIKLGR